ncbi:Lipase 2 [Bienertia sinuspersici]
MQRSSNEEVGFNYWMKWQVPVCGLIIAIPTAIAIKFIKSKPRNPQSHNLNEILWISCWRNLNPKWLLLYRALAFLSMAYLLFQMLLFSGLFAFYFYTQWTFALVMVYFALGTIVSARGCLMSSKKSPTENTENDKFLKNSSEGNGSDSAMNSREKENRISDVDEANERAGILESLMDITYQISAGASVLTDLVFWFILVPMLAGKQFELTLLIGFIHSLNAVFLAIDSLFNALPFEWFGFVYFILWSATYVTFQWILHAFGLKWWPYPFLDLSTPSAPLWYLGLALIHVPCYGVYFLFVKAKNAIFSKLFQRAFVRSQHLKAA